MRTTGPAAGSPIFGSALTGPPLWPQQADGSRGSWAPPPNRFRPWMSDPEVAKLVTDEAARLTGSA
jgi:hypothetical protein